MSPARDATRRSGVFPLRYARWKLRMASNLVRERREYLALTLSAGLLGALGTLALWRYGSDSLADLLTKSSPRDANKTLSVLTFTVYVAFVFMALANVITRFFGAQRMEEREQLMGPLAPSTLFVTELIDALRLPLLILVTGGVVPLCLAGLQMGLPLWVVGLSCVDLVALYVQPTLLVMALYITIIRFLPPVLLGRQGLLFVFFFAVATAGATALNAIRRVYQNAERWSMTFPSSWLASILPFYQSGRPDSVTDLSMRIHVLAASLLVICYILYRYAFLPRLEVFGVQLSAPEAEGELLHRQSRLRRQLFRRLSQPVAAIVLKDLRSSVRDTAQRIAFTALAAVISALVVSDLLFGGTNAFILLMVFFPYALFLVACQGLSTFSAEGGVLENLAQFPLEAGQILRAKVMSHFLMFASVIGMAALMAALAPSPFPVWLRVPATGLGALLLLPLAALLGWLTVTLGAIFPKPGEGGGRKEISIFAMGLFFQLLTLMLVSVPASLAVPFFFGPVYGVVPVALLAVWAGVLRFLYLMAERAVNRALGAEMRAG